MLNSAGDKTAQRKQSCKAMWRAKATSSPLLLLPLQLVSAHQYCSTCHSHHLGIKLRYLYLLTAESQGEPASQSTASRNLSQWSFSRRQAAVLMWEEGDPGHNTQAQSSICTCPGRLRKLSAKSLCSASPSYWSSASLFPSRSIPGKLLLFNKAFQFPPFPSISGVCQC